MVSESFSSRRRGPRKFTVGSLLKPLLIASTFVGLIILGYLIIDLLIDGGRLLRWELITNPAAPNRPNESGLYLAIMGTLWVITFTILISLPLGLFAAIYLAEYASKGKLSSMIDLVVYNLAGVPSVVYGLIGLGFFAHLLALGRSIITAAFTLALLILPIIIVAAREALVAVPSDHRTGAYALGATQGEVVRRVVIPQAFPGMLTASILAISRAIGETAPLLIISGIVFTTGGAPKSIFDTTFTVIPLQIFYWVSLPQREFSNLASAASLVLIALLLLINAGAILLRSKYQVRVKE